MWIGDRVASLGVGYGDVRLRTRWRLLEYSECSCECGEELSIVNGAVVSVERTRIKLGGRYR